MKRKTIIILVIAIFAVFLIVGIKNFSTTTKTSTQPKNGIHAQVELAKKRNITSIISASGIVETENKENIYVDSQVKVEKILVEEGDYVKPSDCLITYDKKTKEDMQNKLDQAKISLDIAQKNLDVLKPTDQDIINARNNSNKAKNGVVSSNASLLQSESALDQAKRNLDTANEDLEKNESLYKEGSISKKQLDTAKEQVTTLTENVKTLEIQYKSAQLALQNAKDIKTSAEKTLNELINIPEGSKLYNQIKVQEKQLELNKLKIDELKSNIEDIPENTLSNVEGTVLTINATEGTFINPNLPIIEIGNLSELKINIDISEYDAPNIKLNQKVKITGDAFNNQEFEGVINKIAPIATTKQTTTGTEKVVKVEVSLLDTNTPLKPGYTVDNDIIIHEGKDIISIPIISPVRENGKDYVFVVDDEFKVVKKEVTLGYNNDLYIEVIGINEGDKIITNPTPNIVEGVVVNPKIIGDQK